MKAHLDAEALDGGYEAAQDNASRIDAAYDSVARLCGAQTHNVAFIENATAGVALDPEYVCMEARRPDRDDDATTTRRIKS